MSVCPVLCLFFVASVLATTDFAALETGAEIFLIREQASIKEKHKAQSDASKFWHTGHDAKSLSTALNDGRDLADFFDQAPAKNPKQTLIKGVVSGVRIEDLDTEV